MITKRELITIGFPNVKITETIDWEQYIQLIKTSTNSHYPMFESDLSNPYSLFGQLQKTIDLDLNPDWDVITEEKGNKFWNESIGNLINYYIDNFVWEENKVPEVIRTWTEDGEAHITGTSFDDLLKANAGNYFIEEWTPVDDIVDVPEDGNWTRWTIKTEQLRSPDFWVWHPMNIDEEHYQQVRGDDRSKLALQSGRNLQFTHSQDLYPKEDSAVGERNRRLEKYLRLIMPKYTRRVEIEDLNRDFWVIGEAISEISGFLFDDESPLAKMFKGITSELTQIWENLIYLWSSYILSQSKECPIKVIYMPLPNNSAQTQRKYDYFEESLDNKESTWKKCEYLIDKYPNNSLVIIPYVRSGNYKHNYFDTYSIAYILTYNRLKNVRNTISVKDNDGGNFFWLQIRQTCQDGMNFQNWVYGVQKTANEQYKVIGNVFNAVEDTPSKYYAAARVDFKGVEAEYNDNGNIVLNNFQLDVADPYKNKIIVNITGSQEGNTMALIGTAAQGSEQSSGSYTIDNYFGYLGEMISTAVTTRKAPITHEGPFQVVKIGDFYPVDVVMNNLTKITEPEGSPDNPFCTDTYGIGAYYHSRTAEYTSDTHVHFIRYDNGTTISSHSLTKNDLETIGKNYLETLFKLDEVKSGLCVTKIGIGYWTGVSGSAWSHGLFSDLFYVDESGEASKLTNVDLFDGYWCPSDTPKGDTPYFTVRPQPPKDGSRWRWPLFECTKVKYKEDGTYTLENGKFTWNDYNETVYPDDGPYNKNRPNATMDIKNGQLVFDNEQNNDGKEMLPRVSYDNVGQIIKTNQTRVDSDCFYVKSNDISWGGNRDAGLFHF